jgi:hypothetical protein
MNNALGGAIISRYKARICGFVISPHGLLVPSQLVQERCLLPYQGSGSLGIYIYGLLVCLAGLALSSQFSQSIVLIALGGCQDIIRPQGFII